MKRATVHVLFGAAALMCATFAGVSGWRLAQAIKVNDAIGRAPNATIASALPEAELARADALAAKGDYDAAAKAYKALTRAARSDVRRAALYNLGNLHLRRALAADNAQSLDALPLLELGKQSYRDLLREAPQTWNARYNLERALRLAPEVSDENADQSRPSDFQRRVVRAVPDFKLELP